MSYTIIHYKNVDLEVEYFYTPFEKPTYDHPGCHEDAEIEIIKINGVDVTELLYNDHDDIAIQILEDMKNIEY